MFGTVLTAIVTLLHVYVFWRAGSARFHKRRVPPKALIGAGLILWTAFFLGRFYGHHGTGALAGALELFGMSWMAMLFLSAVCLLAADIVTAFGFLLPRLAPSVRGLALAAGGGLFLVSLAQGLRPPVVRDYEVALAGLPPELDGTVMVAVSDLHVESADERRWLEKRVAQVRAERPDIVVLLGDIFEGHGAPPTELVAVLSRLSAPMGVWAVRGNHERHGRRDGGASPLEDAGFRLLADAWAEVRPGLVLAGVDDPRAKSRSGRAGDSLKQALKGRAPGAAVLLSHRPERAEEAAGLGAGLMLSAHTHGGQIWPFGYLVRRRYPLLAGRYEVGGMTVIVSRGTGTWGPPMRLWHPNEMLRVTLRSPGLAATSAPGSE
ncbi:MAG: metallophosphoesterase [Elusimicrobiota bacterium]